MDADGGVLFVVAGEVGFYLTRGSMSNHHNDHVEEMEDDYDMDDPADDMIDEHQDQGVRDSDSEDDDYGPSVCSPFFLSCLASVI
jgi:hypothetical protein